MSKVIKDSIIKSELVDWRALQFLQDKNFKNTDVGRLDKLKASIKKHGFLQPFFIWEDSKGVKYCIDGFHRRLDLEMLETEGYTVPDKLPGLFIECKNKKDAAEKILTYSSVYADISDEGLYKFSYDYGLEFSEFKDTIDLANFSVNYYEFGYVGDGAVTQGEQERAEKTSDNRTPQENTDIKQLVIYFNGEEYQEIIEKLEHIIEKEGVEGFAGCIKFLTGNYLKDKD